MTPHHTTSHHISHTTTPHTHTWQLAEFAELKEKKKSLKQMDAKGDNDEVKDLTKKQRNFIQAGALMTRHKEG